MGVDAVLTSFASRSQCDAVSQGLMIHEASSENRIEEASVFPVRRFAIGGVAIDGAAARRFPGERGIGFARSCFWGSEIAVRGFAWIKSHLRSDWRPRMNEMTAGSNRTN